MEQNGLGLAATTPFFVNRHLTVTHATNLHFRMETESHATLLHCDHTHPLCRIS